MRFYNYENQGAPTSRPGFAWSWSSRIPGKPDRGIGACDSDHGYGGDEPIDWDFLQCIIKQVGGACDDVASKNHAINFRANTNHVVCLVL